MGPFPPRLLAGAVLFSDGKNTASDYFGRIMLVIGLTGTIGSGKSEVARVLQCAGVPVISSDEVAHTIMENDPDVIAALRARFGNTIVSSPGTLNRQRLAALVFGPAAEHRVNRQFVEQLVHPRVLEQIADQLRQLEQEGHTLAVVESALIYSAGIEELFDYVVAVVAPEALRRERLRKRGMSDTDFEYRQQQQVSDDFLRAHADFVITNEGTLEDLKRATMTVLAMLRSLPPRPVVLPTEHNEKMDR
ncbi:MAG: dephospho-CoA kinase [Candidatus Kapabacteria bacterium]|nr:dephospho-CoA kinase [Candidatus Kapabacteria bacterium]